MATDAETVALFRKQLELCDVGAGTSLAVLSEDDVRAEHATAFLAAAAELEADAFQVNIRKKPGSFFGPGNSLQGNEPAKAVLKSVDMVVDLVGLLWSKEQTEITDAGPRMLLVIEPIDVLKRMVS
ncbi:MAG: leucyl aminopeptidase, partial [Defluviicoccus sp.]|nr:leucyl aminopeptidase [Defluviicoccus sp.]